MKENRRRGGLLRTAATFVFGAAVGSIAALLYAPASGQVTRRRLVQRVRKLRQAASRRLSRTQRAIAMRARNVREAATEWISEHVPHGNGRHAIRPRHAAAR
jgi:gas vesicle protein